MAVIEQLKELRDGVFGGNLTKMAEELGFTAGYLSNVINGNRGIGIAMLDALARVKSCSLAELLGEREPRWGDGPWWSEIERVGRELWPAVSRGAWSWLATLSGPLPPGAGPGKTDPAAIGMMGLAWDQARARAPSEHPEGDEVTSSRERPAFRKAAG